MGAPFNMLKRSHFPFQWQRKEFEVAEEALLQDTLTKPFLKKEAEPCSEKQAGGHDTIRPFNYSS